MQPFTLFDVLSFVIPGGAVLATAIFGWTGGPRSEPGGTALVGILAASFLVGHLNTAIAAFLEPLAWGHKPGSRVKSTWGLFGGRARYSAEEQTRMMTALRAQFPGVATDQMVFDLAYTRALQTDGVRELLQTMNQQIGFYRNTACASLIAAAMVVAFAVLGHPYLAPALWVPTLAVVALLLVARYRRFWVRFADHAVRNAMLARPPGAGGQETAKP